MKEGAVEIIKKDYLTAIIPPEVLLKIIGNLPSPCFINLVQTNRRFQAFFRTHAPYICNSAILSKFRDIATLLDSQTNQGWLVPTQHSLRSIDSWRQGTADDPYTFSRGFNKQIRITSPGPDYLLFLECQASYIARLPAIVAGQSSPHLRQIALSALCQQAYGAFLDVFDGGESGVRVGWASSLNWYYGASGVVGPMVQRFESRAYAINKRRRLDDAVGRETSEGLGAVVPDVLCSNGDNGDGDGDIEIDWMGGISHV